MIVLASGSIELAPAAWQIISVATLLLNETSLRPEPVETIYCRSLLESRDFRNASSITDSAELATLKPVGITEKERISFPFRMTALAVAAPISTPATVWLLLQPMPSYALTEAFLILSISANASTLVLKVAAL